jgi:radical SAM protein (TIGR01212 family)
MKQRMISEVLKEKCGTKVYRLALSSGSTCPNRDGTCVLPDGTRLFGGCTFCSEGGSGEFAAPFLPVREQIESARSRVDKKIPARIPAKDRRYIAYFQSFTNTYGPADRYRKMFEEAISHPQVVALSVGTRPDCLPEETVDMLRNLQEKYGKEVWVELGLQTVSDETAVRIHRGYALPVFEDAYRRLTDAGLTVIVHVILYLPGEDREDMLSTIRYLAGLYPALQGVKLQLLNILRGTAMAAEYEEKPFYLPTLEEYCSFLRECLDILPEETVIHRLTGDGPKQLLIAPLWVADKKRVINTMRRAGLVH